jgi:hypothetical protein
MRIRLPLLIVSLGALLGVAPATRPAAAPRDSTRFQLRVCSYDGATVRSSVDLSVVAGVPFSTQVTLGDETLTLSGTLRPTDGRAWRLSVRYDDATVDRPTGGVGHHSVATTLEPDLGREANLFGDGDPARPQRRTALTLSATP